MAKFKSRCFTFLTWLISSAASCAARTFHHPPICFGNVFIELFCFRSRDATELSARLPTCRGALQTIRSGVIDGYLEIRLPLIQQASFDDQLLSPAQNKQKTITRLDRGMVYEAQRSTTQFWTTAGYFRLESFRLTGEKCLKTNVDAFLRTTACLVISVT